MADEVVNILQAFGDLIVQKANFLGGFPDGADWLYRELRWIRGFLKLADSRGRKADEMTKILARDIRDVAYDMEDLTDIITSMPEKTRQKRGLLGSIIRYVLHPVEYSTVHDVVVDIQRIEKKIHDISERIKSYGNIKLPESSSSSSGNVEENIGVYRHYEAADEDVVGFDNDKKELVRRLLNQRRRSVISIVGMGGIGKTTLARKLYNDSEVNRHFHVLCWVTVSQSYRAADILKTIAKKIIMGIEKEQLRNMEYEEVREELAKHLAGKRYLIVLDDVWDTRAWPQMKDAFPHCSQNGSRVILTSRNIEVARSADPLSVPYELPFLDDEDSWKLLRKKAFLSPKGIEPSCPKQLEDIGRRLAKKCGGLALALVMLGGLVFKKGPSVAAWMELVESIDWEAAKEHETTCFDILALSYDDLPSHNLRSCFLYLASFPEDSEISVSILINLWVAEGFVEQKHNRILKQTARTYLDELVQRCMVQVTGKSLAHGWVRWVRIHDVLREWCIAEARKEEFLYVFNQLENNDSRPSVDGMPFRRVALLDKMDDQLHVHFPKLRTLMAFGGGDDIANPTSITMYFSHLCFLRVLDLQGTKNLKEIPKDIKKMIHLRYLGLRDTDFKIIPSSIGELQYLQTLDARRSKIEQLPITFWKIPTLRNVYGGDEFTPIVRTSRIPNCKALHVVKWIEAGEWIETCNTANFHELAIAEILEVHRNALSQFLKSQYKLVSLGLIISERNETRIVTDIIESFSSHHQLRSLYLKGKYKTVIEHLPRICEFLPNLTKLVLSECVFIEDPMEQLERLPNLLHLYIWIFSTDEDAQRVGYCGVKTFKTMTCTAGGFPNLQRFEFWGSDVEEWKVEISAMPKLTNLYINYMDKLRNIPDGLLHITSLDKLTFFNMSSEFVDTMREGDGVSWNIIRDEMKLMIIVPIRPISSNIAITSTNNVLPGFVIPGRRIVTNAHVVADHTFVLVRKHGSPTKYRAEIQAVGHECDLAILTVDNEEFWEGMNFLELGDIPFLQEEVAVVGYPQGGDNISVTKGVVSRVEPTQYVHGAAQLMAIQIDAAINPGNSGGPAIMGDKVAGVAFQNLSGAENIGYIIPVPIIKHFITGVEEKGKYLGFCSLGLSCQPTENVQLREHFHMRSEMTGVMVSKINPLSDAHRVLKKDDIILAFDGVPIANDGSVSFRNRERITFDHLVSMKKPGETALLKILRDGIEHEFSISLRPLQPLVPVHQFDKLPSYYIFAGLVFVPLTQPYLHEYGDDWYNSSPRRLCERALRELPKRPGEQFVILSQVLMDDINTGYERLSELQVKKMNDVEVQNLKHLCGLVEGCTEESLRLDLDEERVIVLNYKNARLATSRILKRHRIPSAMSNDLVDGQTANAEVDVACSR